MKKLIFCTLFFIASLSLFAEENYDWLINHNWFLDSGLFERNEPYRVIFRKLEVLPGSIMYHERLRNERFYLVYQIENTNKLINLDDTLSNKVRGNNVDEVEFSNNYNLLSLKRVGSSLIGQPRKRVGKQENLNYPLVGIWGSFPALTEYRIVDPKDCLIYMEIEKQYPLWAIREGTYLLKQINENTFETVSSFPDGRLRLEVMSDKKNISLVPLFLLPDGEKGRLDPLKIYRWPQNY
jgi:hypothetical protein